MKAIIIDDEPLAISLVEKLIIKDGRIDVVDTFQNAESALEYLATNSVDIVFSDIEMPYMNGIDFGKKLDNLYPNILLIYITAYSEFAMQAFDNNSFGYLLKPISPKKLTKLLDKLFYFQTNIQTSIHDTLNKIAAQTIGDVAFYFDNNRIRFRTKKSEEILCFLLHNKGNWVSSDKIIETLWHDKDIDSSKKNLHTSIYYCRKALNLFGAHDVIEYHHNSYRINMNLIEWDYFDFINMLEKYSLNYISKDDMVFFELNNSFSYFGDRSYWWAYDVNAFIYFKINKLLEKQASNPALTKEDYKNLEQFLSRD